MLPQLNFASTGRGHAVLLLLHGLGANHAVWESFVRAAIKSWPGRIIGPDLRGHGRSFHGDSYAYGQHAADVARLLGPDDQVSIVGHSMGGVVALLLGNGCFGVDVRRVLVFSVKAAWSDEELDKARSLAKAPVRYFKNEQEARERMLRVAGLQGLVPIDADVVTEGIQHTEQGWRLSLDTRAFSAPGPELRGIVASCKAPYFFARGTEDPVATPEDARHVPVQQELLRGLGHNPHVQAPELAWKHVCQRWGTAVVPDTKAAEVSDGLGA